MENEDITLTGEGTVDLSSAVRVTDRATSEDWSRWSTIASVNTRDHLGWPLPDTSSGSARVHSAWEVERPFQFASNTDVFWKEGTLVARDEPLVINEETQKEVDKIGTPGKRSIDDLLSAFKMVKDAKKPDEIDSLEDSTWSKLSFKDNPDF